MIRSLSGSTIALLLAFSLLQAAPDSHSDINRASKVLSGEEASRILGEPAEASLRNLLDDSESGKTWTSTGSWSTTTGTNRKTLSLLIRHGASAAQTEKEFEASRVVLHGDSVEGLGQGAFRTGNPAQLNIRMGANWLIISAGSLIAPDPALQEKAARVIVANMKYDA